MSRPRKPQNPAAKFITIAQTCIRFGEIDRRTLSAMVDRGEIAPPALIAGVWRFPLAAVEACEKRLLAEGARAWRHRKDKPPEVPTEATT